MTYCYTVLYDLLLPRRGGEDDPVLLGVFAPADVPTARPRRSAALCAYRLSYIDRLFDENIHMCFNGSLQYRGLPYISGRQRRKRESAKAVDPQSFFADPDPAGFFSVRI